MFGCEISLGRLSVGCPYLSVSSRGKQSSRRLIVTPVLTRYYIPRILLLVTKYRPFFGTNACEIASTPWPALQKNTLSKNFPQHAHGAVSCRTDLGSMKPVAADLGGVREVEKGRFSLSHTIAAEMGVRRLAPTRPRTQRLYVAPAKIPTRRACAVCSPGKHRHILSAV